MSGSATVFIICSIGVDRIPYLWEGWGWVGLNELEGTIILVTCLLKLLTRYRNTDVQICIYFDTTQTRLNWIINFLVSKCLYNIDYAIQNLVYTLLAEESKVNASRKFDFPANINLSIRGNLFHFPINIA